MFNSTCGAKKDGRHKARIAADGHLAETHLSSTLSGSVSSKGIRLVLFLAELNGLDSWGIGMENNCLEAKTKEKFTSHLDQILVPSRIAS